MPSKAGDIVIEIKKKRKKKIIAFDKGERMLLVSFLWKSFFLASGLAGWLTGYVAQIVSISCTNAFLAALS